MIGWGARRMRMTISDTRRCTRNPFTGPPSPGSRRSLRSSPAQKAFPAPRSTTARISGRV